MVFVADFILWMQTVTCIYFVHVSVQPVQTVSYLYFLHPFAYWSTCLLAYALYAVCKICCETGICIPLDLRTPPNIPPAAHADTCTQNQSTSQEVNGSFSPHWCIPSPSMPPHSYPQIAPPPQHLPPPPSRTQPWPLPPPPGPYPPTVPHPFPIGFQIPAPPSGITAAPPVWHVNPTYTVGVMPNTLPVPNCALQGTTASLSPPPTHAPKFCPQKLGHTRYLAHRPPSQTPAEHLPLPHCTPESILTGSATVPASSLATLASPLPAPSHPATSGLTHTGALPTAGSPPVRIDPRLRAWGRAAVAPASPATGKPPSGFYIGGTTLSDSGRQYSLTDALTDSPTPGLDCSDVSIAQPGSLRRLSQGAEGERVCALKGHSATESDVLLHGELCVKSPIHFYFAYVLFCCSFCRIICV